MVAMIASMGKRVEKGIIEEKGKGKKRGEPAQKLPGQVSGLELEGGGSPRQEDPFQGMGKMART